MPRAPLIFYLVCGTPRSGTSLLCGLLASTGLAGRPEEYFWRDDEPHWSERWGVTGFNDYLRAAIAQGSTPNGVFGAKVMYGYLPDLLGKLAGLPGGAGLDDRTLLERAFPGLRFLWIWREDLVAQAVSWSKAIQTNVWSASDRRAPSAKPPRFDFRQIHELVRQARSGREGWKRWFQAHHIQPLRIRYEDLVADMSGTIRDSLSFLGIEHPPGPRRPGTDLQASRLDQRRLGRPLPRHPRRQSRLIISWLPMSDLVEPAMAIGPYGTDSGIVPGVSDHEAVDVARDLAERLLAAHGQEAVLAVGLHGTGARRDGHGTLPAGATDLEVSVVTTSEEVEVPARALRYQGLVIDVAVIAADLYLDEAGQIGPLWPLAAEQYLHHQALYDPTDFFGKLRDAHQAAIASSPPEAFLTAAGFDLAQLAAWEARARADELSGDLPAALLAVKEGALLAALVIGLVRRTLFRDAGDALKTVATMPDLPDGFTDAYRRLLAPTIDPASAVLALGRVLAALEHLAHEHGVPFEADDLNDFV